MSANDDPEPKLYTVEETGIYLDCSGRQIREEIRERKITYRRPPGGIRFTKEDLLERLRPCGEPGFIRKSRVKKPEEKKPVKKRDDLTASWKFSDQNSWPCGQGASFSTFIRVVCNQPELGVSILEVSKKNYKQRM